jgi:hypothetical protein
MGEELLAVGEKERTVKSFMQCEIVNTLDGRHGTMLESSDSVIYITIQTVSTETNVITMTNIFQICKRMVQAALSSRIPITTCKYC